MNQHVVKPSELMSFLHDGGFTNYKWKGFLSGGKFPKVLLENVVNNQEVIGKFVSHPSEGELKVWPKLHHENLNPLLEILWINKLKILISPVVGKCLGSVIHDIGFAQHPLCFERKKSYLKDVLLGLDYMHRNSFCVLNLSERNVKIYSCSDKAVISDFSYAVNRKKITKASLPSSAFYKPREVQKSNSGDFLNGVSIDMWYCGLLFFQVFTQYLLLLGTRDVCDTLEYVDSELLRRANGGASLLKQTAPDLKKFLKNLLSPNPNLRISANEAFKSSFIQTVHNRLDGKARKFWKTAANTNCGILDSVSENEHRNSKTGSSISDVDVSVISANSVNGDLPDSDVNNRKGKSFPVKTKSEPGTQTYRESPNPKCRGRASFPFFSKQSRSVYSPTSCHEEKSSFEGIPAVPSDLENDDSSEYDEEDATIQNLFSSSELHEKYPSEAFLTDWEPEFFSADMEDLISIPYSYDSLEDIKIFRSMLDSSLDDIPPEIISMNRLSTVNTIPSERGSYTKNRRKVSKTSDRSCYGSERNVQDKYCNSGPPKHKPPRRSQQTKFDCNVADTRSVFNSTDSPPCLKPPSPGVRRYSSSRMSTESAYCGSLDVSYNRGKDTTIDRNHNHLNANEEMYPEVKNNNLEPPLQSVSSWYSTNEKPTEKEDKILPPLPELFGSKETSIGSNPSSPNVYEKYSGVSRKSRKNMKGANSSRNNVDSHVIIDNKEQLCCEDSESPIRRKWYHKFCVLCKCTSQTQRKP